ncbi:hypothetical protein TASIC1_0023000400 [Trichoderma asperellum]|uniref:Xylanolytic transcriptional activator regulatory domain-containing protein n=1 Tax=Trichoderma asperellum TaxID=101201 RepID=A0A6V8R8K9_TRIAP|nr:hypothetical protein TASIC1_0023000400 [Trichoderma asperellum]
MPTTAADGALEKKLCSIRWETVGMYFALIGMVIASTKNSSTNFSGRQWFGDRKATSSDAFDACLRCEALCNRVGQMNDLSVWLAVLATTLSTWCFGDDSCQAWRLMGNLSSAIFALNYHRGFQDDMNTPTYLIELRKRAIALSHELDKSLATFVGRPPRLNRSYCTIELPLDLSDSVIVGPAELLELQISRLDGDDGILRDAMRERLDSGIVSTSQLAKTTTICRFEQGNYELCKQAQLIFSKALDQILNHEMPLTRSLPDSQTVNMYDAPSAEFTDAQSPENITQDLQWAAWLDTVDFQGEPWLEMLKPPANFFGDLDDYCY